MYEHHKEQLLTPAQFAARVARHGLLACSVLGVALGIGVLGYHFTDQLGWLDSLLNASMILSGMGPVSPLPGPAAKLFASAYALFSGTIFIAVAGIFLAPLLHRILHRLHLEVED